MQGVRTIERIRVSRFLSYGPESSGFQLEPLNVLIGPNGSGKSNLLEVFRLLRSLPGNLRDFVASSSEPEDYLWKGTGAGNFELLVKLPDDPFALDDNVEPKLAEFNYQIILSPLRSGFAVIRESAGDVIGGEYRITLKRSSKTRRIATVRVRDAEGSFSTAYEEEEVDPTSLSDTESVLATGVAFPGSLNLRSGFQAIRIFSSVGLGRESPVRYPRPIGQDESFLFEDGSNLPNVMQSLQHDVRLMRRIFELLRVLLPRVTRISTGLVGNRLQVFVEEVNAVRTIPGSRLSDGTLRYLCLLSILLHPNPPGLICLEDPEIGLHPDAVRSLGPLLIEASKRTQLIVTTHSDLLVSALSDVPEAIVICEHDGESSHLRRLDAEELKPWLENYSLGDLWLRGQIGGVTEP